MKQKKNTFKNKKYSRGQKRKYRKTKKRNYRKTTKSKRRTKNNQKRLKYLQRGGDLLNKPFGPEGNLSQGTLEKLVSTQLLIHISKYVELKGYTVDTEPISPEGTQSLILRVTATKDGAEGDPDEGVRIGETFALKVIQIRKNSQVVEGN